MRTVLGGRGQPGFLPGLGPHAVRPVSAFYSTISPPILALAWSIGTWVPSELQNLVLNRISWFYYLVIVMPGVYVAVASLASLLWRRRSPRLRGAVALWAVTVLAAAAAAVVPFRSSSSSFF